MSQDRELTEDFERNIGSAIMAFSAGIHLCRKEDRDPVKVLKAVMRVIDGKKLPGEKGKPCPRK